MRPLPHARPRDRSGRVGNRRGGEVDDSPNLAAQFGVMNIPTLIVFKNGEPVKKMVGVQSKDAILKALA